MSDEQDKDAAFKAEFQKYPSSGRPETPDFWRLARLVSERDSRMDALSADFPAEVGQWVDLESLTYLAEQRVTRLAQTGLSPSAIARLKPVLMAMYIDAFTAGASFQASGGHQQKENTQ